MEDCIDEVSCGRSFGNSVQRRCAAPAHGDGVRRPRAATPAFPRRAPVSRRARQARQPRVTGRATIVHRNPARRCVIRPLAIEGAIIETMIRKLSIGLAIVLALLVVAALAVVFLVDVDRFKPQIQQYVKTHYDRTLAFDGKLSLSFVPKIAVALPRTTLSVRNGDAVAARLAGAQVGVALMPLLGGRIVADTIRIDGLQATIERRADGTTSIDDLLGQPAAGAPATTPQSRPADPSKGASGGLPAIDIGGLELRNAAIEVRDAKAGNRLALRKLDLSAGRIQDGRSIPIDASFGFASEPLAGAAKAGAGAPVGADAATARFTLKAQLKPELADPARRRVTVSPMKLTAAGNLGLRRFELAFASPVLVDLVANRISLDAIDTSLTIDEPSLASKAARLALTGKASVDSAKERVTSALAGEISGGEARSALSLDLAVAGFAKPAIDATLKADAIDVDAWLPPGGAPSTPAPGGAGGQTPPAAATPAPGAAPTPLPDLSALSAFGLDAKLAIGQLKAQGMKASKVALTAKVADGRLAIAPFTAELYGGRMDARIGVTPLAPGKSNPAGHPLRASVTAALTNVLIDPLLQDAANKDLLEGKGDVKLDLATSGATVDALKRALDGTASIRLADGAIKGINLGEQIRNAQALLGKGNAASTKTDTAQKTDFTEMSVSFRIDDGIATSNDLDAKSPLLRLGGDGHIDIPASRIDYTARVSVVGTAKGQDGRDLDELRGVTIPVVLTGPFAALEWKIDWVTAGREALKGKLGQEVKERLQPKVDELKDKIAPKRQELENKARDKVQDALKGLFK
ncbi:MAG: AsmA family protein [Lautropia sp.]